MYVRALLAAAALSLASAAQAVTIDAVGDTFSVSFDGNIDLQTTPGLTASATFLVTELDAAAGRFVLQISLTNTTDGALFKNSRVSALGFDVDADLATASSSGLFANAVIGGKFPNQFGPVDVCAIDNKNNCSGGGNGGLQIGQSGTFTLVLDFAGSIESVELSNFGVRYQSINSLAEFANDSGTGTGTVAEPQALALLGVAGLAFLGRRRRAA